MNQTERDVIDIVARITKTPVERIHAATDLRAELNVDSLQGLQIIAALEKHFGVTVPDEDLDAYSTIALITETVERLRGA